VKRCLLMLLAMIVPVLATGQTARHVSGKYSISGVVVNAMTGQPLDRTDVTLLNAADGSMVAETSTNADGRFIFEQLAAGKYSLRASRRGYVASAYDEHEGFSTAIVTGEGLVSDGLRFRLPPRAVITGTVTDDSGDPVQQARVSLYRQNARAGLGNIVRAGSTITDDTGTYEFARLEAGNYYVAVAATPWFATRPDRDAPRSSSAGQRSPLDVAYATTFYADVTDSDSATPIPVKAGDRVLVNFAMHPLPAVHLSIQVPVREGSALETPQLRQEIFGLSERLPVSAMTGWLQPTGDREINMELNGVAPGHYSLELPGRNGSPSRSTSVDVTGDTKMDETQVPAMADVSGKVAMEGGEKLPAPVTLSLRSPEGRVAGSAHVEADGSFNVVGVPPGNYEVWVAGSGTSLAVIQMTAAGATADGHLLRVGSQPVSIAATLAEGSATVTGFATRDGKAMAGVMILLVPRSPTADREMFRRDQSDSDGSFALKRVIPGEYTLVAIEDGWTIDWAHPEVIAHYLAKGQKVTVPPHSKDVTLKNAVEVQSK
jgi:hypothetical protein